MKKLEGKYAETHKLIVKTMEKMMADTSANAVVVSELTKATDIDIDTRVLNKHLEVLEIGGWGHFNKNRHLFVKEKERETNE